MSLSSRNPLFRGIWEDPWAGLTHPSKMPDQHFGGLMPDALRRMSPSMFSYPMPVPIKGQQSQVMNNLKEFKICFDVQHFKHDEIDIKIRNNRVIIHARHLERPDEHGFIEREFTRQYDLPKDVDPATVTSSVTRDGMLTLRGPKIAPKASPEEYIIPIVEDILNNQDCENNRKDSKDSKGPYCKEHKDCKKDDCKRDREEMNSKEQKDRK